MRLANSRASTLGWLIVVGCFRKQSRMGENEANRLQPAPQCGSWSCDSRGEWFRCVMDQSLTCSCWSAVPKSTMCLILCHVFRYLVIPGGVWGFGRNRPWLLVLSACQQARRCRQCPSLQAKPGASVSGVAAPVKMNAHAVISLLAESAGPKQDRLRTHRMDNLLQRIEVVGSQFIQPYPSCNQPPLAAGEAMQRIRVTKV